MHIKKMIISQLKYIFYKIKNNIYVNLYLKGGPPLIFYRYLPENFRNEILIDLRHPTTHLGDRLFFIPLIQFLIENGVKVQVLDNDLFSDIYFSITGNLLPKNTISEKCLVFIIKPSFMDKTNLYAAPIIIDFSDIRSKKNITNQLLESFSKLLSLKLKSSVYNFKVNVRGNSIFLDQSSKYIIFNNYIDSGKFRKLFLNLKKLEDKCSSLRNLGYKIIHVGSSSDKLNDDRIYNFIDLDLRGLLSPSDLIGLVHSKEVFGVVSFDNFVMHVAHIVFKPTWILFRGRFMYSQYLHHMKFVNNTFLPNEKNITYL